MTRARVLVFGLGLAFLVAACAATGGEALAWKNPDGSLVAVMYNSGSATTYTVAIAGKKLPFAMPLQGWATVHVPAS